jgi:hypothetical protein
MSLLNTMSKILKTWLIYSTNMVLWIAESSFPPWVRFSRQSLYHWPIDNNPHKHKWFTWHQNPAFNGFIRNC